MSQPEIVINCQACGGRLRAPRTAIGTTVGCPTCKAGVMVLDPAPVISVPAPMIVDMRRKLGHANRGETLTAQDGSFKERLRSTTEDVYKVDPHNPVMKRRDMRKLKHGKALTDWEDKSSRHSRRASSTRLLAALIVATVVMFAVFAGIFWKRLRPPRPPVVKSLVAAAPVVLENRAKSEFQDQLWETVSRFATAPSAADLLPFIREPRRVGPELIKYYQKDNPWVPLELGQKPDLSDIEVHHDFIVFNLPLKDYSTIPIGLEKTSEGFLVDWESFTGYSELSWPELRRTRPHKPVLLRAVLSPSAYFNKDFPSATTHSCFRVSDLHSDHVLYGYVVPDGPVDLQIKKILLSAPSIHAVIRVRYPENSTNDLQLEITEVLEKGWIFREDDLPEPPLPGSPSKSKP